MKYSKQATIAYAKGIHKDQCLEDMNTLILKEGCTDNCAFAPDNVVLNLDCVEAAIAKVENRNRDRSMDSAFVAEDTKKGKQEIVFVEYRFNYENLKNLNRNVMMEKVADSTAALGNPPNIHSDYYFVFNAGLKNQAISRFGRMNPTMPQHFIAVDMEDVKQKFF